MRIVIKICIVASFITITTENVKASYLLYEVARKSPRIMQRTISRFSSSTVKRFMGSQSQTHWSEEESALFIKHGNCFVPNREKQINILTSLIPHDSSKAIEVVELCSGAGLISRSILKKFIHANLLAMDLSETMLAKTIENLSAFRDRVKTKQFNLSEKEWRKEFTSPIDVFVSSLAIHHLDDEEKLQLYRDLYPNLNTGGALLIADLIRPNSKIGFELAASNWDEETCLRSEKLMGNDEAYRAFQKLEWNYFRYPDDDPIDKPSPILHQLKWLEEAGFKGVDVFWLHAGHAIYGGYKIE
jgi:tRNA (cmo5U34)-methyltransferase